MLPRCSNFHWTLAPFLYPLLFNFPSQISFRTFLTSVRRRQATNLSESSVNTSEPDSPRILNHVPEYVSHLNPSPSDYSRTVFVDRATVTVSAGSGGHGCISFLREKYVEAGPPNGGDGGTGGNVYIQAVRGETSLHKLARRNILRAGRGKNGQGKTRGGERGDDVIIHVPVGTVVREVERIDPVAMEEDNRKLAASKENSQYGEESTSCKWDRKKWILYPATSPEDICTAEFPKIPRVRRSALSIAQVKGPVSLDLTKPMKSPLLLAAGAVGGLGNPHFVTKMVPRPKYATKGDQGLQLTLELELKLLADVGLVGLPNAGKSTLLRAISKSRARVGNWAFTTLQPNIGTVVLDDHKGRPFMHATFANGEPRTNFTVADIPGLVKDAHLDRGLGISFLRHVERARVLAFVVDLNAGDAIGALKALWREVGLYEKIKIQEEREKSDPEARWNSVTFLEDVAANQPKTNIMKSGPTLKNALSPKIPSVAGKPWFVIATKADLPNTQENFVRLEAYIAKVNSGEEEHPSQQQHAWPSKVKVIPISAINGHGTERITEWIISLLDD